MCAGCRVRTGAAGDEGDREERPRVRPAHPATTARRPDACPLIGGVNGNPVRGAAAATLSGEPLTAGAASIVGKTAHMRRVQNEWPQRAMLQA